MFFKRQSFERVDSFIILFCILSATASCGWLVHDILFNQFKIEGHVPIGKMTRIQNHVKRKFNRSLIWYDANSQETVYENDWVFTGSNSNVTIELEEGGELRVAPDSLVILNRANGSLNLNLQHGSMVANNLSKKIEVNVVKNGVLEKVDPTQYSKPIGKKKKQKPKVKQSLAKRVDKIKLNSPQTLWLNENGEGTLTWQRNEDINFYKLELSQSKDMVSPISKTYSTNKAKIKLPQQGRVYWRVSDSSSPQIKSDIYSFEVKINKPPMTSLENENQTLSLTPQNGQTPSVPLRWTDKYNSWDNYDIQIAKTSTFDEILFEENSMTTEFQFKPESSGVYFWRVRGKDRTATVFSKWSEPRSITIEITKPVKKQIILAKKNIIYRLNQDDISKINNSKNIDLSHRGDKPTIRWRMNAPSSSYRVQLSRQPDFSNNFEDAVSKSQKFSFKILPIGVSFFRVIAEDSKGQQEVISQTGRIATYFPTIEKLNTKMDEETNTMSWNSYPGVNSYEIKYIDQEGGSPQQKIVSDSSFQLPDDFKYMKFQVRAWDEKTRTPLSDFSETSVQKKPEPKKEIASVRKLKPGDIYPVITSPAKRKTFVAIGQSPVFFVMRWKFSGRADSYDVEIARNSDMRDVIYKKTVQKRRAAVNQPMKPGKYYMRVRAIKNGTTYSWSDTEVFRVLDRE